MKNIFRDNVNSLELVKWALEESETTVISLI